MCAVPRRIGLHLHVYNPAADLFALLAGAFKCDLSLDVALRSGAICLQRTCPRDFVDHQQRPLRGRDDWNHGSKGREPLSGIPAARVDCAAEHHAARNGRIWILHRSHGRRHHRVRCGQCSRQATV